jgi:hypothetical protein
MKNPAKRVGPLYRNGTCSCHYIADNVSEWDDTSIRGLLFRYVRTMKNPTKLVGLVQSEPHHHFIVNELVLVII